MGNSLPPPAGIDLVGSYARRRGSEAELVLWEPKARLAGTGASVVLRKGKQTATGTVERQDDEAGRRLVCQVERAGLSNGTWSITLRSSSGDEPVDARLLVQADRPLVLLWGARGSESFVPRRKPAPRPRKQVAAAAGKVMDRAVSPLPPKQAVKVRQVARRLARRTLG